MGQNKRIIIIATSANSMSGANEPTGLWLEELTNPYYAFKEAGFEIVVASIAGGKIPVDARSLDEESQKEASVARYMKDSDLQDKLANTPRFDTLAASAFDAMFLPGGHGTMFDYPQSTALAAFIEAMNQDGKIIAAVCHGPAGLVAAKKPDGTPLVAGRRVTGFTDREEHAVGLENTVPFLLESKLRELGAHFEHVENFQPFALRDGNLITGQNPPSAAPMAKLVIEALTA